MQTIDSSATEQPVLSSIAAVGLYPRVCRRRALADRPVEIPDTQDAVFIFF